MGTLYIVATPIGNLNDITLRALETLRTVDKIAAEDTRHSQKLLQHHQINTPLIAYHEHNALTMTPRLITHLQTGFSLALISDAGTPLISDPGYPLVKAARLANIVVVTVPGPCAAIAALSIAGLPTDRFVFEGFLPAKINARQQRLQFLQQEQRTLIFYEAPHRILSTLQDMAIIFGGDRPACLARELTKRYETVYNHTLSTLVTQFAEQAQEIKGEIVLIVAGKPTKICDSKIDEQALSTLKMLLSHLPLKQAVQLAANLTGVTKNNLYTEALRINHEQKS